MKENTNMKRKFKIIISTSAASALALSALAQDTYNPNRERPNYSPGRVASGRRPNRLSDAAKSSDLIGMTVKNYQNEKLGKVEDLAVDVESGRVVQVILSTGGFLGIGDTLTAVPPGALHHDVANRVLHLDADKEKLKDAPKFEMSNWAENSDSNHLAEVYSISAKNPPSHLSNPETWFRMANATPRVRPTPFQRPRRMGPGTKTASRVTANG